MSRRKNTGTKRSAVPKLSESERRGKIGRAKR